MPGSGGSGVWGGGLACFRGYLQCLGCPLGAGEGGLRLECMLLAPCSAPRSDLQQERRLEPHAGLPGAAQLARPARPCALPSWCEHLRSSVPPPLAPAVRAVWSAGCGPSCPSRTLSWGCIGLGQSSAAQEKCLQAWLGDLRARCPPTPPDPSLTICKHQPSDGCLTHLGSILGGAETAPPHIPRPRGGRHPTDRAWGSVRTPPTLCTEAPL